MFFFTTQSIKHYQNHFYQGFCYCKLKVLRIFLSIREHIHVEIRRKYIWNSKRVKLRQRASIRSFTIFNLACTAPKIELEYSYLSFLLVLLVCHKQKPSLLFLSSFYCSFSIFLRKKDNQRKKTLLFTKLIITIIITF